MRGLERIGTGLGGVVLDILIFAPVSSAVSTGSLRSAMVLLPGG